jgi:helix-turn-helix protein
LLQHERGFQSYFLFQELREKNWKAMDALSAAEKQQKAEINKAVASVKVNEIITTTFSCFID